MFVWPGRIQLTLSKREEKSEYVLNCMEALEQSPFSKIIQFPHESFTVYIELLSILNIDPDHPLLTKVSEWVQQLKTLTEAIPSVIHGLLFLSKIEYPDLNRLIFDVVIKIRFKINDIPPNDLAVLFFILSLSYRDNHITPLILTRLIKNINKLNMEWIISVVECFESINMSNLSTKDILKFIKVSFKCFLECRCNDTLLLKYIRVLEPYLDTLDRQISSISDCIRKLNINTALMSDIVQTYQTYAKCKVEFESIPENCLSILFIKIRSLPLKILVSLLELQTKHHKGFVNEFTNRLSIIKSIQEIPKTEQYLFIKGICLTSGSLLESKYLKHVQDLKESDVSPTFWETTLSFSSFIQLYLTDITSFFGNNHELWSIKEYISILKSISPCKEGCDIVKHIICSLLERLRTTPIACILSILRILDKLRIYHEEFCQLYSERLLECTVPFKYQDIVEIIKLLYNVGYREHKLFNQLTKKLLPNMNLLTPEELVVLFNCAAKLKVYDMFILNKISKMLIHNKSQLNLKQITEILCSCYVTEYYHPELFNIFVRYITQESNITKQVALKLLICLSRMGILEVHLYDKLTSIIMKHHQEMDMIEIGTFLLALSRTHFDVNPWIDKFVPCIINNAPQGDLFALIDIICAFAAINRKHDELFAIASERFIVMKMEMPAISIASVLNAFAKVHYTNDRFFIEMIPRARYVAFHGSIQDVMNVLTAYTEVNIWHYNLFLRLGDRAIQLKPELKPTDIVVFLSCFSKFSMRYERLFTEFSSQIKDHIKGLSSIEIQSLLNSYAQTNIQNQEIFDLLIQEAKRLSDEFTPDMKQLFTENCQKLNIQLDNF